MNRQQFEHFLHSPGELSLRDVADLGDLIRSFPYCQTLYLMLARAHSMDDSIYFQGHLRMAAAHAVDRKRLKQLILDNPESLTPHPEASAETVSKESTLPENEQVDMDHFRQLISELEQTFLALQLRKAKTRAPYDIEKEFQEEESPPAHGPSYGSASPFFDPVDIARKSVIEHDDLATETLAQIYAEQGHLQRAIKIYQQLIVKFPEKSRYFAAQIKNLEKKAGI